MVIISLCLRSSTCFQENEDWAKSIINSLPRSFNSLRTESADICSLNSRTIIHSDCRSGVDLRGGAGVCFGCTVIKLEITE